MIIDNRPKSAGGGTGGGGVIDLDPTLAANSDARYPSQKAIRTYIDNYFQAGDVYFVSPTGNDANTGKSWATAFLTIQKAIDTSFGGDRIEVKEGTYTVTQAIDVNKGVHIYSAKGRAQSIIQSDGVVGHRVLNMLDGNAVVSGFTIKGGISADSFLPGTAGGEGGNVYMKNYSTIEDCIIENGSGYQYGGNVFVDSGDDGGGIISRCIIRGGVTRTPTGAGGGVYFSSAGFMEHCSVYNNTAPAGAGVSSSQYSAGMGIRNCTITKNTATGWNVGVVVYGGGWAGQQQGAIKNSIIYGNSPNDAAFIQYVSGAEFEYNDIGISQVLFGAGPSGAGNISVDPLFVNAGANDFNLKPSSPVIKQGRNVYRTGFRDAVGNLVVASSSPDLGAYQLVNNSVTDDYALQIEAPAADNATTYVIIGPGLSGEVYVVEYAIKLDVSKKKRAGSIRIGYDVASGAVIFDDEYSFAVSDIAGLDVSADYSGGNLRLVIVQLAVGENSKVKYNSRRITQIV